MNPTPTFAGGNEGDTQREQAHKTARWLDRRHPELGYSVLWSAASYLLRDGQRWPLAEGAVVREAKRRLEMVDRAAAAQVEKRLREQGR